MTLAFVRACGGDPAAWQRRWQQAARELAADRSVAAAAHGEPPYLGLAGYGVADADRFFGRRQMVEQLASMLHRQRFLAVFGVSGSGKSSLLRAGLIPAISGGADGVVPVLVTPGSAPLAVLRQALGSAPAGEGMLLVVDQFEELFTLCSDPGVRAGFVDELAAVVESAGDRSRVVIGVRADFYARCSELPVLAALMVGADVPVGPLNEEQLREVITGPAKLAGLTVERALVAKVLADAADQPGALPLVSHALLETWRQRRGDVLTVSEYEAAGGVAGAIAQTAEALYDGFDPTQRETARQILVRLVTFGEGVPDTRRRVDRAELDLPEADTVLQRLAGERLIVLGEDTVEIAHEALISAWPRLHDWLHADREEIRLHRQLTEATALWLSLERDPGALYRGARLTAWADRGLDRLNELERTFLTASRRGEARELRARRRRVRLALAALTAGVVVTSVLAGLALSQAGRANDQRDLAVSRQLVANARAQLQVDQEAAVQLAGKAYDTKDTTESLAVLRQAVTDSRVDAVVPAGQGQLLGVAFSPDGRQIATSGSDGTVRLWELAGEHELQAQERVLRGHTGQVWSPAFSPDGRRLAACGDDGLVTVWDMAAGNPPARLRGHRGGGYQCDVAFSPDGRWLASTGGDDTVRVWDPAGRRPPLVLRPGGLTSGVVFSADGRFLAASSTGDDTDTREGRIWIWPASGRGKPRVLRGHEGRVENIAFSPDGKRLASSGGLDHTVRVWSTTGQEGPLVLRGNDGGVETVAFSPDGQRVAAGLSRGAIHVWNATSGTDPLVLHGHDGAVWSVTFSPDGARLASASTDATVRIWDPADAGHPQIVGRHDGPVWTVAVSRDGRRNASGGADGIVRVWPGPERRRPLLLRGHDGEVLSVAVSIDGRRVASGGRDGTVRIWDPSGDSTPVVLRGHDGAALSVDLSPDGKLVASAGGDGSVRIWNTDGQGQPRVLRGHEGTVRSIAFSPDGRRVASGGADGTVRIWDAAGQQPPTVLRAHPSGLVWSLAFSPDGRFLASGGHDGAVKIWNSDGKGQPQVLAGHQGLIWSLAFSPDGKQLASAGDEGGVRIWDTSDGHNMVTFRGHNASTEQVRYTHDSQHLISAHDDGTVRMWLCETCGPAREVRALADSRARIR